MYKPRSESSPLDSWYGSSVLFNHISQTITNLLPISQVALCEDIKMNQWKFHNALTFFNLCYILMRSFSTPFSDSKINTIALLRGSQVSHLIPSIPEIPLTHEQSFIRIAPSLLNSLESPQL